MEGFRQLDEFVALKERLPPLDAPVALKTPLAAPLRELSADDLDLVQAAISAPALVAVFDLAPATDLEIARRIESLVKRGYLVGPG